jgi:hypothetical protein
MRFVPAPQDRLWELHIRIPSDGDVAISGKHGGGTITDGVTRVSTPSDALRLMEELLVGFAEGDQLFITARTQDSNLSMWRTASKATGLYWCASALAQLWRPLRRKSAEPTRRHLIGRLS